jgi:hypothetical protein
MKASSRVKEKNLTCHTRLNFAGFKLFRESVARFSSAGRSRIIAFPDSPGSSVATTLIARLKLCPLTPTSIYNDKQKIKKKKFLLIQEGVGRSNFTRSKV